MEFVEIFVFESVFMGAFGGLEECFLDYWFRVRWFFRDDAVFAEDVVPIKVVRLRAWSDPATRGVRSEDQPFCICTRIIDWDIYRHVHVEVQWSLSVREQARVNEIEV
jgi:hypothetical protein